MVSGVMPNAFPYASYMQDQIQYRLLGFKPLMTVDIIENQNFGTYVPANGAQYPDGSFGDQLKSIAQMIKLQLGLQVVTVDLGGWDTHNSQGIGSEGYFAALLKQLADGLTAFYTDLDTQYTNRLTVTVMSEFGRRLRQNADYGTDHGHGGIMLILGGNGKWRPIRAMARAAQRTIIRWRGFSRNHRLSSGAQRNPHSPLAKS